MKRAIIVGSGPSGSTVARLLARSGEYTVLVLEKGRNFFSGLGGATANVKNDFPNDELAYESRTPPVAQDPFLEPRSFRTDPSAGARTYVGDVNNLPTTVGGGTIHYDAKARRFREVDFITNTLMGGSADSPAIPNTSYTDWPMQYKHLEPFYAVIEEIVGVQGPARRVGNKIVNPNPVESWRSTPYPMPPGVPMLSGLLPAEAANRLGFAAPEVPTSVLSRPYRGRAACNDCGFCGHYGCAVNAKSGGAWQLHDALRTGRVELRTQAHVVRVEYERARGGRYRASGVTYVRPDGTHRTEHADLVVLANSPIEAARLSFMSGIGNAHPNEKKLKSPQPTSTDPSGMLGRNIMFHYQSYVIGIMNQDIHAWRGRTSSHTMDAFCGPGPSAKDFNPAIPRGGIMEMGGNLNPIVEASEVAAFAYGARHKEYMQLGPFRKRFIAFTLQGEDMPQLTNYVDLDPEIVDVFGNPVPRVTYKNHPYELAASAYYLPQMHAIMAAIGGPGSKYASVKPVFIAPLNTNYPAILPGRVDNVASNITSLTPFSEIPQTKHIMGTHRLALDPEHGPCDPYGRYWAFDNLYHAGGGLFCTAPGFNVTLTIWALSYWVGAAILRGVGGKSKYSARDIDAGYRKLVDVIRKEDGDTMIARALGR